MPGVDNEGEEASEQSIHGKQVNIPVMTALATALATTTAPETVSKRGIPKVKKGHKRKMARPLKPAKKAKTKKSEDFCPSSAPVFSRHIVLGASSVDDDFLGLLHGLSTSHGPSYGIRGDVQVTVEDSDVTAAVTHLVVGQQKRTLKVVPSNTHTHTVTNHARLLWSSNDDGHNSYTHLEDETVNVLMFLMPGSFCLKPRCMATVSGLDHGVC
jgi:hypothetical protein